MAYTDGLLEEMNGTGEQFGEERVRECVNRLEVTDAASLARRLLEDAKRFSGGGDLNDDGSLLVVRFPSGSPARPS